MAQRVTLTVVDAADACTGFYSVRYRLSSASGWTDAPPQYESTIYLDNLLDGTEYTVEVRRTCCNGAVSDPRTLTFTTGT